MKEVSWGLESFMQTVGGFMIAHEMLMVRHMIVAHIVQLTFGEHNLDHCAPFDYCMKTDLSRKVTVTWTPSGLQYMSSLNEFNYE